MRVSYQKGSDIKGVKAGKTQNRRQVELCSTRYQTTRLSRRWEEKGSCLQRFQKEVDWRHLDFRHLTSRNVSKQFIVFFKSSHYFICIGVLSTCLRVCLCATYLPSILGIQKKVLEILQMELEFWATVYGLGIRPRSSEWVACGCFYTFTFGSFWRACHPAPK